MALTLGTHLGPYEIQDLLGAGGMGEVYRARDTRLNRTVAVKVLPGHLSKDTVALQRFEREAKAVSTLSDPRICTLYDIGQHGDIHYLIMEYLEGETLADCLKKGRLPMPLVLRHGIEICEALEKAHQKGIIHRDLKPGNIMLTRSGLKLLDFGLARWHDRSSQPGPEVWDLPTLDQGPALTQQGTIAGTVPYMAPEQLEGKQADHRTDIFAAGTVLYEMACGRRAFQGESKAGVISAILSTTPPAVSEVRSDSFPIFDYVVDRCLAKDPDHRWQSAQDVSIALRGITDTSKQTQPAQGRIPVTRKREYVAWSFACLLLILAVFFEWKSVAKKPLKENADLLTLSVLPPDKSFVASLALSADGRRLVFTAINRAGQSSLWVRSLDSLVNRQLPGTEDASYPFWSPDGRSIGFFANGRLKTVPAAGGSIQILCDVGEGRGGAWNHDGTILYSVNREGIYRIGTAGGKPVVAAQIEGASHRWPYFLPDGRHFLYPVRSFAKEEESGIYLGLLDSHEKKQILTGLIGRVEYAAPGYLLFVRQDSLVAQAFDAEKQHIQGEAFPVIDGIGFEGTTAYSPFSVASNGMLATYNFDVKSQLIWFDRTGTKVGSLGGPGSYAAPNLSPDQRKLLIGQSDPLTKYYDLWIFDLSKETSSRFTFEPTNEIPGVWSADNNQIVFTTNRLPGAIDLYQKPSSGMGQEKVLLHSTETKIVTDLSRDGRYVLYEKLAAKGRSDLWILPLTGQQSPQPLLETEANEKQGQFSPDGKWIAYVSDETGKKEIYVRSFPPSTGGKWQISREGGEQPRWRSDGKEMYYVASDRKLMAPLP